MAPSALWHRLIFNLLLQLLDGVLTYQVVAAGVPEGNPLVAGAIVEWGALWGLVYWKTAACLLLVAIFGLRHRRRSLALRALTFTAAVYACVSFIGLCAAYLEFGA